MEGVTGTCILSLFPLYFYIFCFPGKSWFHYIPCKTDQESPGFHTLNVSLCFNQEKYVQSLQKSPLIGKRRLSFTCYPNFTAIGYIHLSVTQHLILGSVRACV